jgi:hypothetical protein
MDPSRLEEIKKEPEIVWMLQKIEEKRDWIKRNRHRPEVAKKLPTGS